MNTHTNKIQDDTINAAARSASAKRNVGTSSFQFVDNRPEAVSQRKLREMSKLPKEPIQRAIIVDGKKLLTKVEHLEGSGLDITKIMAAIKDLDSVADRPQTIEDAINDLRLFQFFSADEDYIADATKSSKRLKEPADLLHPKRPTDRIHQEVNTAPDFISQGRLPQTMRISGLMSCIAIFIEAGDQHRTERLIGMHYTTLYHTNDDDNKSISAIGQNALQSMALLSTGLRITKVHLCHRIQRNEKPEDATTSNLKNLTAHFGMGICQIHNLGLKGDVTALLAPDGKVDIDI
jgi:hypothetical protein